MNFAAFLTRLQALQASIAITAPVALSVRRSYWGAPAGDISDLPAVINVLSEPERALGMGGRREAQYRIGVQLLAARATPDDERHSRIATEFWFAAKERFDADPTLQGTVTWAVLQGGNPTVPVILQHGGQAYIGFDAQLMVHVISS